MRKVVFFCLALSSILVGLVIGCMGNCEHILQCHPPKSGDYVIQKAEYDADQVVGDPEFDSDLIGAQIELTDSTLTLRYDRPDGTQWQVVYRRGGASQ